MSPRTVGLTLVFTLAGSACTGDRLAGPTGETGFESSACRRVYEGAVVIEEARVSCEASNEVRFYARTRGWTSGATLFSQETGNPEPQWADEHDLDTFKFGACQDFDLLEQELVTGVVAPDMWEPNETTRFSCEQEKGSWVHHGDPETGGVMSYVLRVYAVDGRIADCLAFGHDPQGVLDSTYTRDTDPDRPDELKGCTIGAYAGTDAETPASDTAAQ